MGIDANQSSTVVRHQGGFDSQAFSPAALSESGAAASVRVKSLSPPAPPGIAGSCQGGATGRCWTGWPVWARRNGSVLDHASSNQLEKASAAVL
jgi:hypothetical protein